MTHKPKPKYGWSDEIALHHVDPVVPKEAPGTGFCYSTANQDAWRAEKYDILRANDINPHIHVQVDATKLIKGSAFERACQQSSWVQQAFSVMSECGARRALPSGIPAPAGYDAKWTDTVFVGTPAE